MVVKTAGLKFALFLANFASLIVASGVAFFTSWFLFDPRRNWVLHSVDVSQDDPLLLYSAYLLLGVCALSFVVSFAGCCAATRELQILLASCTVIMAVLLVGDFAAILLAIMWHVKFKLYAADHLYHMATLRYGRDEWVTQLMDAIQFYYKCCGFNGTENYYLSYWQIVHSRGAPLTVPMSCCKQRQESFPPDNFQPIDYWCQYHPYNSSGQFSSVYTEGCVDKISQGIFQTSFLFIGAGLAVATVHIIAIFLSIRLYKKVGFNYSTVS